MSKLKEVTGRRNRIRGLAFEQRIYNRIKKLKPLFIVHSAGSKGLFDIVAHLRSGKLLCITCKTNGYLSPSEQHKIFEYIVCARAKKSNVRVELYYMKSVRVTEKVTLTL